MFQIESCAEQQVILVDEGLKGLNACVDVGIFNGPKKNSNSTQFTQGFQSRQNLYTRWSGDQRDKLHEVNGLERD